MWRSNWATELAVYGLPPSNWRNHPHKMCKGDMSVMCVESCTVGTGGGWRRMACSYMWMMWGYGCFSGLWWIKVEHSDGSSSPHSSLPEVLQRYALVATCLLIPPSDKKRRFLYQRCANTLSNRHVFLTLWIGISKTGLLPDVNRQEIVSSAVCSHVF
jgi:hypothetical protein